MHTAPSILELTCQHTAKRISKARQTSRRHQNSHSRHCAFAFGGTGPGDLYSSSRRRAVAEDSGSKPGWNSRPPEYLSVKESL